MGKVLLSAIFLLLSVYQAESHPQCLDYMPPFKPAFKFTMCKEYENFGCCNAKQDSLLYEKYTNFLEKNKTLLTNPKCRKVLKNLLCQECSPYAAHLYDAEDRPGKNSFPAVCTWKCRQMLLNCTSVVELITKDENLKELARKGDRNEICSAMKANDPDYCYPKVKTNPKLSRQLGKSTFYRKKEWGAENFCLPLCVKEVASGLYNPVSAKPANDGTNRMFVVEQRGVIWVYESGFVRRQEPFLDIRGAVLVFEYRYDERGLLDMVFHPNFSQNGLFYIYYTVIHKSRQSAKLAEMKVSDTDRNKADLKTQRTLLIINQPRFNHNGGTLIFRDDGYLYLTTGDGGGGGDPFGVHGNGQNKKTLLGKVLRIDVNKVDPMGKRAYSIPPDNPFVGDPQYLPEIYALGVRNMWRCSMDRGNATGGDRGRIFCGDVGQGKWEEVDLIEKGANYGWRAFEGHSCYDPSICNAKFVQNYVPPIHAYSHQVGKSITGGYVYRGCQSPNLNGKYIFGDYSFGKLFALNQGENSKWFRENICMATDDVCKNGGLQNMYNKFILSFAEDEGGELYILSTSTPIPGVRSGKIYRLVDPSRRGDPSVCPSTP